MKERLFSIKHLWVLREGDEVTIGLTDFLQEKLGAFMFVNLPDNGDVVSAGETFGDIESRKTVMEMESPVSGKVVEVNEEVIDDPGLINDTPYDSWLIRVRVEDFPDDLIDEGAYRERIAQPWMQNH